MIFSNIKQFFKQNKKIFYYIGFFIVIFALSSDSTFAVETTTKDTTKELIDKTAIIAEFLLKGISVLLALITFLATMFLSPEWINGSLFGLNTYFKDIWILVSNVVYFAFAFILIWVAFMNIIGKNTDQYQLKQALPKFIVGVLIVPFSWFLIQFILSLSAILTVSALSLPFDTFSEFNSGLNQVKIPTKCELNLNQIGLSSSTESSTTEGSSTKGAATEGSKSFIDCNTKDTKPLEDVMNGGKAIESIYGIISMYTYGVLSFDTIGKVDKGDFAQINTLGDLVVKIVFDLLFVVVYSILIITLGIVLMIRGIYIWVYTMISPVFGLMYFFGKKDGGGDGFFGKFNVKEFIALAMVPVYTMLALSFGLLFIYVVGMGLTSSSVGQGEVKVVKEGTDSSVKIGEFELVVKGAVSKDTNVTGLLTKIGGGALGIVGSLILKVFGIVILWGTVMTAMRSSEITKQITQPIFEFGNSVGKMAAAGPGNIPIFGGQSMNSMNQVASSGQNYISSTLPGKRSRDFMEKHNLFGTESSNLDAKDIKTILPTNQWDKISKSIKQGVENAGDANIASGKEELIESLLATAKQLNIDGYKDKKVSDIKGKAREYVDLVAAIDREIYTSKRGSGAVDIISDGSGTKNNLEIDEFNKLIKANKASKVNPVGGAVDNSTPVKTTTTNEIIVKTTHPNSSVPSLVTLGTIDVAITDTGKLSPGSVDNFAKAIAGKTEKELNDLFAAKDLKFNDLLQGAKLTPGENIISKNKDGIFQIDLKNKK